VHEDAGAATVKLRWVTDNPGRDTPPMTEFSILARSSSNTAFGGVGAIAENRGHGIGLMRIAPSRIVVRPAS